MSARTAALLGASGATGKKLLARLLADPAYGEVIAVGRRETGISHPKLENRVVDFDRLGEGLPGAHVDDAYCTFGTTIRIAGSQAAMTRIDHEYVVAFAGACQAAGAARFAYLSAANADANSSVFYSRLKGRTEEALKAMGFADLGIFRPGMIVAQRDNRRWLEEMLFPMLPLLDRLMFGEFKKYRSIPVETLAQAISRFSGERGSGLKIHYWQDMTRA